MEKTNKSPLHYLKKLSSHGDILFALSMMSIILILLVPISPLLMDVLLSVSITLSIIILMTTLFIDKSLDFNSFPTVLLIATMLRLSLNIASTRLILSKGHTGPSAAGHIIETFGNFVMQGSVVIGIIVFAILTIINFIVITKGSGRIAEVSARFSLDAMPGKQMAIDADLSAGIISEEESKARRKELESESTFFGAMDGASKFVRGDAIAGLLITFINFIAGIIIGAVQRGLTFADAVHTYTLLTIGDGLVSQIPALVVSTASGLLVTKSGTTGSAEKAIVAQMSANPQILSVTSGLLLFISVAPGMPTLPLMSLSVLMGGIAYMIWNNQSAQATKKELESQEAEDAGSKEEELETTMQMDTIKLEIGHSLLPLISKDLDYNMVEQIKSLRKQIAQDLGFVLPAIRVQDNILLDKTQYIIRIKDIDCGKGYIQSDKLLAMNPMGTDISLEGEQTTEPTFGLPAMWIDNHLKHDAIDKGYTVIDPCTVILTHLTEIVKDNILDLVTYTSTQELIESISKTHSKLIEDLIPGQVSIATVQQVLQNLLSEKISIRDLATIIEAIGEKHTSIKNTFLLTEHVRSKLARQLSAANTNENGYIPALHLSQEWEKLFTEGIVVEENRLSIAPSKLQEFVTSCKTIFDKFAMQGELPVLVTSQYVRPYVKSVIDKFKAAINVISHSEIHPKANVKTLGQI